MNRITGYILCISAALLSAAACSQEDPQQEGTGWLSARVHGDGSMEVLVPQLKSDAPAVEDFSLAIYDALDNRVAYFEDYKTLIDSPYEMRVGTYTAVVSSASSTAAFDLPFYTATKEFSIAKDQVENLEITATVANTKVTVEYSDEILEGFSSYVFTVTNGLGTLVFDSADGSCDREGYFSVTGELTWTLSLVNINGQKYQDLTGTVSDVKAAQHYRFSWTLDHEPDNIGAGAISIVLNDSFNEREFDLVLDPDDSTVPTITENFEVYDVNTVEIGESVSRVITLTSADGFASATLTYADPTTFAPTVAELIGASSAVSSALASAGIVVSEVSVDGSGVSTMTIDVTSYLGNLPIATYNVSLVVTDNGHSYASSAYTFEVITDVDAEAIAVRAWAVFADVQGRWFAHDMPEGLSFQYKKASDTDWTDYGGTINPSATARTYTARLTGLDPQTDYVFRAVSAADKETAQMSFTTGPAPVVPNMSFDGWYQDGSTWYPNVDADNFYWDSANGGTSTLSIYPTNPEDSHVVSGRAANLQSKSATLVGLAAGNIYTGKFVRAIISLSNPGAELDWGIQFDGKPLALKGWYDYRPATVNVGSHAGMSGKTDIGQIQIMLTDWSSPFRVNTQSSTFVNPDTDSGIIAYGTLDLGETSDYNEFTINLEYRDYDRTPTYIVIVASASKYGDYFTGGVGSTLYLDEFSLVYDPEQLTEKPAITVGE